MRNREIRIFISSTFNDMHPERDWLVRRTFPCLRQKAAERGVALTEVDLRWGITESESREGKTLAICLDEIINSHPFFIGLLGSRYGWTPTRGELNADVLPERYEWVGCDLDNGLSITEIEMQYGVLRNPEPVHASFYIRNGSDTDPRQVRLKEAVRNQTIYPVDDYSTPEELGALVEKRFMEMLDELYPADEYSPEQAVGMRQLLWADAYSSDYLQDPRTQEVVDRILNHGDDVKKLLVTGTPGTGKTALLSDVTVRETLKGAYHVIPYFSGCGDSVTAKELGHRIEEERQGIPQDQPILVIVDDAASVTDGFGNPDVSWIDSMDENDLLLVSVEDGQGVTDMLAPYVDGSLTVEPITQSMRRQLAHDYFYLYSKHLTDNDLDILSRPSNVTENTQAFKTMLEELRCFGNFDRLPEYLERMASFGSTDDFYSFILGEKEGFYNTERHPHMVGDILSLLEISSHGLGEPELVAISGIPQMYVSQFILGNASLVNRTGGVLRIAHENVSRVVRKLYLSDEAHAHELRGKIISYFEDDDTGRLSPYRDEELPYQYWKIGDMERLYGAINGYEYLSRSIRDRRHFFLRYWVSLLDADSGRYRPDVYFDTIPDTLFPEAENYTGMEAIWLRETMMEFRNRPLIAFAHMLVSDVMRYKAAEDLCVGAVGWIESNEGSDELRNAWLEVLAVVYGRQNRFADALSLFEMLLADAGDDLESTNVLLNNVAETYLTVAERTDRIEYAESAIAIQRMVLDFRVNKYGKNDADVAVAMSNLASSLWAVGDYDEAERLMAEGTEIYKVLYGGENIDVAINLHNRAIMALNRGHYDQAMELAVRAMEIFRSLGGDASQHVEDGESLIDAIRNAMR